MLRYLLRRLALSVPLVCIVSILTFIMVALIPGDPAVRILGGGDTAAQYRALDVKLGLTEPVLVQYWHWLDGGLHGSLGPSLFSVQPAPSCLPQRLPVPLWLVIGATVVSLAAGVALGMIAATGRGPVARLID